LPLGIPAVKPSLPDRRRPCKMSRVEQPSRSRVIAGLVILLALAGLTALSIASVSPPAVVGADAPADQFSADRAYQHVEQVGAQVHVAGSAAAGDVSDYIAAELTAIGLEPEFQDAVGYGDELSGPFGMARVRNVVAVLPGTASTGRVFLFAHYDSVQVSYGGNDDGAGVATLLETARAVMAGPPPVNDLVFVFTDAEEACLCGAEAFVSQSPLAAQGGVALNFESRGSTGPAVMFETNRGNADVVGVYGTAVPYPVATSFAVEVYRILPNNTDFTPFLQSGRFTGLNTAYIDGSPVYHTPQDKPSTMNVASLQHHGSNALALARAFGAADIATLAVPTSGDSTYFPALGALVRYPGWLNWPLAVLALVAVGGLAFVVRHRQLTSWPRVAAGFGLATIPLLLAPVVAQLLWMGLVALRPGYANMIDPWWPGWFRLCVLALVGTVLLTWYGLFRRRMGTGPLTIGALGWLAVLGLVLAAVTPGGSYLASLPALGGATGCLVAVTVSMTWVRWLAAAIGGAVAVIILAPTVYLFFPALGLATGAAAALFAVMLGFALLPVFELIYPPTTRQGARADDAPGGPELVPRHRWWAAAPGLTAGVLAVGCLIAGLVVDHFDAEHPAPAQLAYALDADSGQAWWASTDARSAPNNPTPSSSGCSSAPLQCQLADPPASGPTSPGEWLGQYITGTEDLGESFGLFGAGVGTGPAQAADLPAPELTVVSDTAAQDRRQLTVTVRSQRDARLIYLDLPDSVVLAATVDGRDVPPEGLAGRFGFVFHAPPDAGLTVTLELQSPSPAKIRLMDGTDGLDGLPGFTPRPEGIGIQGSHTSELVVVATTVTV
jgi:hypothetical protein